MKKLFSACTLALSFLTHGAMAQTDTKAKAVLDAVTKKVNSLKSLKANFVLNLSGGKGSKVNETKKGSIAIKGQKYRITLAGQEIICDNKTIWTYNKDAKEVQITNYNASEQSISPAKLLTNFYDKEYKYSYKGVVKNAEVIELVPTDRTKQVSRVELMIDKNTSMISGGNIYEKNGNKVQYTVSNVVTNSNVPDTHFSWNPKEHPGVETVDLR
jgi:chaperone LolA